MGIVDEVLKEYSPDVFGITGVSCQNIYIKTLASIAKKWRKDIPVICGGIHATLDSDSLIQLDTVDGVLRGEGELAFLEYLQKFQKGIDDPYIKNFWFKRNGNIIKNGPREFIHNLDSLPLMDYKALDYQKIIKLNSGAIIVMMSRGCSANCTFCSVPTLRECGIGNYVRYRSVGKAIEDIEYLSKNYRFESVYFRDDTFTWDREWTIQFSKEYSKCFKYPFEILTRADCLDRELMDSLKHAGCQTIFLGLDSGNDFISNEILKRELNKEKIVEVCDYLQTLGIKYVTSNQIGLPYETPEKFQDTIEINKKIYRHQVIFSPSLGAAPRIWVFNPFPGTPAYKLCVEKGWLKKVPDKFKVYRESYIDMPFFPRKEIDKLYRRFRYLIYKDNYLFYAWLYRLYDSRSGQFIMDILPDYIFGRLRLFFSRIPMKENIKETSNSNK